MSQLVLQVASITAKGGQDGSYHTEADGSFTTLSSSLDTGRVISGFNKGIYRFAVEFNVGSLPAGATIASAVLHLSTPSPALASISVLAGFLGDGRVTAPDIIGGKDLQSFQMPPSGEHTIDVTSFVKPLHEADAGWVGFNIRQEPLHETGRSPVTWHGPGSPRAPKLVVQVRTPRPTFLLFLQRLVGLA